MGCFSVQKPKRRSYNGGEQAGKPDNTNGEAEASPRPALSAPPSFKSRVKAIQNSQRFINSNPKLRSSHPSYGSRESRDAVATASSPLSPLGGRARSATELGSSPFDVTTAYKTTQTEQMSANISNLLPMPMPMPLPSPQPSPQPNAYRLRLPTEHANGVSPLLTSPMLINPKTLNNIHTTSLSKLTPSPTVTGHHTASSSSTTTTTQISQLPNGNHPTSSSSTADNASGLTKVKAFVSELQPLPPPKEAIMVSGLRSFGYEELVSACQNFSPDCCIHDADGGCFTGTIKVNGKANKSQDVVVIRTQETWQQQGFREWVSELLTVAHLHGPHLCKLIGFYGEDGSSEQMLVYEKLQKGCLSTLLFEASDVPPLDWPTRMKIAYGAAQGLSSLHERCPKQVLYNDFRASSIQVDANYTSKLWGYRFVNTLDAESYTSPNNPRVNAYRSPETASRGEVTLKSNVWSYGVVLLELLSGKQNIGERTTKDEKHNLVRWAKPFLMDEGRLFLIMDPKLQGRFPSKGAKIIADLALQCLKKDPTKRPTMKAALDMVKCVQEMRYTTRFSLKEPTKGSKFAVSVSPSMPLPPSLRTSGPSYAKTSLLNQQRPSYIRSPTEFDLIESPPLRPLIIPPRCCASTFAMEDIAHHQKDYSSAPLGSVTGF